VDSLCKLWVEGMSRYEREAVGVEMKQPLCTLVNSVKNHLEDGGVIQRQVTFI